MKQQLKKQVQKTHHKARENTIWAEVCGMVVALSIIKIIKNYQSLYQSLGMLLLPSMFNTLSSDDPEQWDRWNRPFTGKARGKTN